MPKECKITIRTTDLEKAIMEQNACRAKQSMNTFMKEAALRLPAEDKEKLAYIAAQLCAFEKLVGEMSNKYEAEILRYWSANVWQHLSL